MVLVGDDLGAGSPSPPPLTGWDQERQGRAGGGPSLRPNGRINKFTTGVPFLSSNLGWGKIGKIWVRVAHPTPVPHADSSPLLGWKRAARHALRRQAAPPSGGRDFLPGPPPFPTSSGSRVLVRLVTGRLVPLHRAGTCASSGDARASPPAPEIPSPSARVSAELICPARARVPPMAGAATTTAFGQAVIGPPGSGKTTYCLGMSEFLRALGRRVAVVNLDPANEGLPYECAVDVGELVGLGDVMDALRLGPNGGLLYCMEYLEANLDWLRAKLEPLRGHYFLFDCPGQVELCTHHGALRSIFSQMAQWDLRVRLGSSRLLLQMEELGQGGQMPRPHVTQRGRGRVALE